MPSERDILEVLRTIPDPEMPISIVDLGIVEEVRIGAADSCFVEEGGPAEGDSSAQPNRSIHPPTPSLNGRGNVVTIDILPTFIGCPALGMIEEQIKEKVAAMPGVDSVHVNFIFDPPWSVDRITKEGRASLKEHGVTVPDKGAALPRPAARVALRTSAVPCPFCESTSTRLESPFGPTRCRMIYYCDACRNSFEHLKKMGA